MINIRSNRIAANPNHGTFSAWTLDGRPICLCVEPYHRDNAQGISCIPAGQYTMRRTDSPRYGENTWEITNIQGRDNVLVHWGNRDEDTRGCAVLGEQFGLLYGDWAVLSSKNAYKEFMELTANETEMLLTITDSY